jgi:hypothetical protein
MMLTSLALCAWKLATKAKGLLFPSMESLLIH